MLDPDSAVESAKKLAEQNVTMQLPLFPHLPRPVERLVQ